MKSLKHPGKILFLLLWFWKAECHTVNQVCMEGVGLLFANSKVGSLQFCSSL